jgi:hypothetical protein
MQLCGLGQYLGHKGCNQFTRYLPLTNSKSMSSVIKIGVGVTSRERSDDCGGLQQVSC